MGIEKTFHPAICASSQFYDVKAVVELLKKTLETAQLSDEKVVDVLSDLEDMLVSRMHERLSELMGNHPGTAGDGNDTPREKSGSEQAV